MSSGSWIHVLPFDALGNQITRSEWSVGLALRYHLDLKDLPTLCHGCGCTNSRNHAFACHTGGLLSHAHDDIARELILILRRVAQKTHVRPEPVIHPSHMPTDPLYDPTKKPVVTPLAGLADGSDDDEDPENRKRGDIACKHLFDQGTTAILDVRCVHLNSKSNKLKDPEKVLKSHEMEKRRKYAAECWEERMHFAPFVVSRCGVFGKEATNILRLIAKTLEVKWDLPYSRTAFFVKSRMSIAILRSTTQILYGERKPMKVVHGQPAFFHDNSALLGYWSTSRWS